jgi:hypothetical protein
MNIKDVSQVNFNARLLIDKPIKNLNRWENITKKFTSKTSDFANYDCFVLENPMGNLTLKIKDFNKDRIFDETHPYKLILSLKGSEELLKLNDNEIIDKFKKMMSLIRTNKEVLKTEPYTKENKERYIGQGTRYTFENILNSTHQYNCVENCNAIRNDEILSQNIEIKGFNNTP